MKPTLEQLFSTLKGFSYPEQMKVSQAYTNLVDPYDAYPDSLEMGLFDPIANPNEDIVGNLTNEALNFGNENEFETILKSAILDRWKYGNR